MADSNKCLGLMGLLFGHKYIKYSLEHIYRWDKCFRCGKPAG